MSYQSVMNWIRHPASIILIIVFVLTVVIMSDQSHQQSRESGTSTMVQPLVAPSTIAPRTSLAPDSGQDASQRPVPLAAGGELPKIVQRLSMTSPGPTTAPAAPGRLAAPDLGSLLGRLEDKVKAEPDNINNRLLLAQTYKELGLGDKALEEARAALKQFPDQGRAKLVLASILSSRQEDAGLKEAVELLTGLRANTEIKQYLVEMYLGDAWIRLGNHPAALKSWKQALEGMPLSDNRRAKIEKGIEDLSSGAPGA